MGVPLTKLVRADSITSISPWQTMVRLDNQTDSQVMVFLASSATNPDPAKSTAHVVPPKTEHGICSGWYYEPRATVLIRTKLDEAKILRVPHQSRIMVKLLDRGEGLYVEAPAGVTVEDYANPTSVRGLETVPMAMHGFLFSSIDSEVDSKDVETTVPLVVPAAETSETDETCGFNVVHDNEEASSVAVTAPLEKPASDLGSDGSS